MQRKDWEILISFYLSVVHVSSWIPLLKQGEEGGESNCTWSLLLDDAGVSVKVPIKQRQNDL